MTDSKLRLSVGNATSPGTRPYNEDGFVAFKDFNKFVDDSSLHNVERSLFAVYDGHGGENCMRYLKKNLHKNLGKALSEHKGDTVKAIKAAFEKTENGWVNWVLDGVSQGEEVDSSGSTATVCLIEDGEIFSAFVGDSPAWLIKSNKTATELSRDHKPNHKEEQKRITKNGGKVRKSSKNGKGPYRIYPGGIAVARSFGDVLVKLKQFGGKPGTLIAEPEIIQHQIDSTCQFLVVCSDGITDNISNKMDIYMPMLEAFVPGLETARKSQKLSPVLDLDPCAKQMAANIVERVVKTDGEYQDNATALIVMFGDELVKQEEEVRKVVRSQSVASGLSSAL